MSTRLIGVSTGHVLRCGLLAAAAAGNAALAAPAEEPLRFDQVFATRGEPAALHYRATYTSQGTTHRLEVWRDGDRRLVRRTDDAIEIHVARQDEGAAYQMVVLDLRRRIETRVTRNDLYRIGTFTDWFDLAHGLRFPKGDYRLTALPSGRTKLPLAAAGCRWYLLEQGTAKTKICWSTSERLPTAMLDDRDRLLWRIDQVSHGPAPADVFEVRDQGFVRNDASHDISGD